MDWDYDSFCFRSVIWIPIELCCKLTPLLFFFSIPHGCSYIPSYKYTNLALLQILLSLESLHKGGFGLASLIDLSTDILASLSAFYLVQDCCTPLLTSLPNRIILYLDIEAQFWQDNSFLYCTAAVRWWRLREEGNGCLMPSPSITLITITAFQEHSIALSLPALLWLIVRIVNYSCR